MVHDASRTWERHIMEAGTPDSHRDDETCAAVQSVASAETVVPARSAASRSPVRISVPTSQFL
jgi:hypothetical protein